MPICLRDCSAAQAQEQEHRRRLPATNLVVIMIIGGHHLTLPPSIHPSFRHSSRKREKGDKKVQAAKPCCAPVVFPLFHSSSYPPPLSSSRVLFQNTVPRTGDGVFLINPSFSSPPRSSAQKDPRRRSQEEEEQKQAWLDDGFPSDDDDDDRATGGEGLYREMQTSPSVASEKSPLCLLLPPSLPSWEQNVDGWKGEGKGEGGTPDHFFPGREQMCFRNRQRLTPGGGEKGRHWLHMSGSWAAAAGSLPHTHIRRFGATVT